MKFNEFIKTNESCWNRYFKQISDNYQERQNQTACGHPTLKGWGMLLAARPHARFSWRSRNHRAFFAQIPLICKIANSAFGFL